MLTKLKKHISITTCMLFIVIGCAMKHQERSNRLDTNEGREPHSFLTHGVGLDTSHEKNPKKTGNTKGLEKVGREQHHFGENGAINVSLSGSSNRAVIYPTTQKPGYNMYSQRAQDTTMMMTTMMMTTMTMTTTMMTTMTITIMVMCYLMILQMLVGPVPLFRTIFYLSLRTDVLLQAVMSPADQYGIDLRTYDAVIAGGYEGPIVIAGNARRSELVEVIVEGEMPPGGPPLPVAQMQLIIDWINEGAKNSSNNETTAASDNPTDAGSLSPSFQDDILPILTNRCAFAGCHVAGGPGGIDLRTYDAVIAGGSKGAIVIAGDAGESELVKQIVEGKMPPSGPPLPAAQIQLITDWINEGAKNNSNNETEGEPPIPPGDSFPPPDANRDGVVNILDLIQAALQFGQVGTHLAGDVNSDGKVDVIDLILISVNLSENAAAPASPVDDSNLTSNYHSSGVKRQFQALAALESQVTRSRGARLAHDLLKAWLTQMQPLVRETKLLPNYPNPFNPETWIPYQLAEAAHVKIRIYDVVGDLVRTLNLGTKLAGSYLSREQAAYWDGRNDMGEVVSSGAYFYTLVIGDYQTTRRMIVTQ